MIIMEQPLVIFLCSLLFKEGGAYCLTLVEMARQTVAQL